ncbi:MAG: hypothetical protein ACLPSW_01225 [Roseiarcus sp.]
MDHIGGECADLAERRRDAVIFDTLGPFRIRLDEHGNIPRKLDKFWAGVENEKSGLSSGKGCYLFGIKTSGASSLYPWYVGKTGKSFCSECFQPHKRVIYLESISRYERVNAYLLLIPRLTEGGALYTGNGATPTSFLENHLIHLGIQANPELQNKKNTKLFREVQLPGILNSSVGQPSGATTELRRALRL